MWWDERDGGLSIFFKDNDLLGGSLKNTGILRPGKSDA